MQNLMELFGIPKKMFDKSAVTSNNKISVQAGQTISAFPSSDNWLQYLNLQINQYQFCLFRTKIKNRLERRRKIVTHSYKWHITV